MKRNENEIKGILNEKEWERNKMNIKWKGILNEKKYKMKRNIKYNKYEMKRMRKNIKWKGILWIWNGKGVQ